MSVACETCVAIQFFNHLWCSPRGVHNILIKKTRSAISCSDAIAGPHQGQQSHLPVTPSHSHTNYSHQGQQSHLPVTVTPSHSHTYQSQSHQVTVTPTNHTKVSSQNGPVRKDTRGERGTHIQHKCTRFQI